MNQNCDFVRAFGIRWMLELARRNDGDYTVNPGQMEKLERIVEFFRSECARQGGNMQIEQTTPKAEHSGITASFLVFDLCGERVREFCDVMKGVSAISIDCTEDGICISCTVPDVFVRIRS